MNRMVPNGSVRSEMSSKLCTRDRHGVGAFAPVMISGGVGNKALFGACVHLRCGVTIVGYGSCANANLWINE